LAKPAGLLAHQVLQGPVYLSTGALKGDSNE
jgi:hypothetical protein